MTISNQTFKKPKFFWFRIKIADLRLWLKRLRHPENIWYGGSIKRENALRSVGPGWAKLINNLYDAKPKWVRVIQVKEKYAGLRFYTNSSPDWFEDLVSYYSMLSEKTCEQCGEPGKVRGDLGWILTLCTKHYKETKEAQSRNWKRPTQTLTK